MSGASFTKKESSIVNALRTSVEVSPIGCEKWTKFVALWDTGAMSSVVTDGVAKTLGLVPVSEACSRGVNGVKKVPVYPVSIRLPGNVCGNFAVTEGESGGGWDVLVGMDIISHGDFCVSNFGGKTTFSFRVPSLIETDYVAEAKGREFIHRYRFLFAALGVALLSAFVGVVVL